MGSRTVEFARSQRGAEIARLEPLLPAAALPGQAAGQKTENAARGLSIPSSTPNLQAMATRWD